MDSMQRPHATNSTTTIPTPSKEDSKQLMREASHLLNRLGQHAVAQRLKQAAE
jgi:hypothetical protein